MKNLRLNPCAVASCHRRGLTLTETIIVLGVIGFLLAGIWAAATYARENARVADTVAQVQRVAVNIRNYTGQPLASTFGDTTAKQISLGFFVNEQMDSAGTMAIDPFGGQLSVAPNIAAKTFDISVNAPTGNTIPTSSCVKMLSSLPSDPQGDGGAPISSFFIGGSAIPSGKNPAQITGYAPNATTCSGVTFRYSLN